jgi:phosphoglycerate dehydrogenase-like enzyme
MIVTNDIADRGGRRTTVLVSHDLYTAYRGRLEHSFPKVPWVYVDDYDDLPLALAAFEPEVVLSFKLQGGDSFPRELILGWPTLRWLHAGSVGIDHLAPWDATRLSVTNSSGIHTAPMSEYVVWAVLNQTLQMPLYARQQRERRWLPRQTRLAASSSAVVVGFGTLGQAIGRQLKRFGMRVIGVRTRPDSPSDAADDVVPVACLGDAIAVADFVIIALPLTPLTRNLFDAAMIERIKPGSYVINIGRGGILDEVQLSLALRTGALSGALLDVLSTEPLLDNDILWDQPNLSITPHVSADIEGWQTLAAGVFSDNLGRWLRGEPLMNLCDPTRGY